MALSDNTTMLVSPTGGNGFFGGGDSWAWIILLFLFAGGGFGGMGGNNIYPWMNQADITTSGFQNAALGNTLSAVQGGVTSGFGDLQTAICGGFGGVNANISNGFAQSEIAANSRQMANMNQIYGIQSQLAQCCCDNRLATCQTQNIVQNEGNATRFADANNTRDLIQSQTANTQAILDKLCQLELDSKTQKIADLERQLTMADLKASQTAQNAFIQQGFSNEVDALYNRLSNCPVPTTPVYGRTPIFTCNNGGCGCGM